MITITLGSVCALIILSALESPNGTKILCVAIIKTRFVSFACTKILNAIGKKDFGEITKVCGICACGGHAFGLVKNAITPLIKFIDAIGEISETTGNFFEGVGNLVEKFDILNLLD